MCKTLPPTSVHTFRTVSEPVCTNVNSFKSVLHAILRNIHCARKLWNIEDMLLLYCVAFVICFALYR